MLLTIFLSINYLDKTCAKLVTASNQLEDTIKNDNWDKSYDLSIDLLNSWQKYSNTISIFIHHGEIDNINNELFKLTQYTKCKNKDESLASIHLIKLTIKHIREMESLSLKNIL